MRLSAEKSSDLDQIGMAQHLGEHGRHAAATRDLVVGQRLQIAARVEAAHDHQRGAGPQRRLDRASHRVLVEHRRRDDHAVGRRERPVCLAVLDAPDHAAVGERDALGDTGGAGRIGLEGDIVERHRLDDAGVRLPGRQCAIVGPARPGIIGRKPDRDVELVGDIAADRGILRTTDNGAAAGIAHDALQSVGAEPEIDRHRHDAEAERTEKHRQERHTVGNRDDAAIVLPQSDRGQRLRGPAHLRFQLGIGVGTRRGFSQIDDRGPVRMLPQGLVEENPEIDDLEVPLDPFDDRRRRAVRAYHRRIRSWLIFMGRRTGCPSQNHIPACQ